MLKLDDGSQPTSQEYEYTSAPNKVYTARAMLFTNITLPSVQQIKPSVSSGVANELVTVIGESFLPVEELHCLFGAVATVQGMWRSSSVVACTVPALSPGNITVEVSNDAQHFSGSKIQLVSYGLLAASAVKPSQGGAEGSGLVTVTGQGFAGTDRAWCRFGMKAVYARVLSSVQLVCEAPSALSEGVSAVLVEVSRDGVAYTAG